MAVKKVTATPGVDGRAFCAECGAELRPACTCTNPLEMRWGGRVDGHTFICCQREHDSWGCDACGALNVYSPSFKKRLAERLIGT